MVFFKASSFWDYEDGESGGEILRWVAEKFDEGGDLETEREGLSVGGEGAWGYWEDCV